MGGGPGKRVEKMGLMGGESRIVGDLKLDYKGRGFGEDRGAIPVRGGTVGMGLQSSRRWRKLE